MDLAQLLLDEFQRLQEERKKENQCPDPVREEGDTHIILRFERGYAYFDERDRVVSIRGPCFTIPIPFCEFGKAVPFVLTYLV